MCHDTHVRPTHRSLLSLSTMWVPRTKLSLHSDLVTNTLTYWVTSLSGLHFLSAEIKAWTWPGYTVRTHLPASLLSNVILNKTSPARMSVSWRHCADKWDAGAQPQPRDLGGLITAASRWQAIALHQVHLIDLHNNPMRWVLLLPCYKPGDWGLTRSSKLPRVMQLASNEAGIWTHTIRLKAMLLTTHAILP